MNTIISYLREELSVSLRAAEKTDYEDTGAVYGEKGSDTVELGGEDLEHNEGEGELREGSADVSTFEGSLSSAHFNDFVCCQHCRAGSVHSQTIAISRPSLDQLVRGS
jgi:hypothetical protein